MIKPNFLPRNHLYVAYGEGGTQEPWKKESEENELMNFLY
jgi:hypothetical protein